jgi:hypothetical protein
MKSLLSAALVVALIPAMASPVASGRVGVYAIVERVVFEPNEVAPQRMRLFGAFIFTEQHCADCFAGGGDANRSMALSAVRKGYLHFELPSISAATPQATIGAIRREWSDIRALAGTGTAIAFGSWRYAGASPVLEQMSIPDTVQAVYVINGKRAIHVQRDSAISGTAATYETNVGIVKLSESGHGDIIRRLRAALNAGSSGQ